MKDSKERSSIAKFKLYSIQNFRYTYFYLISFYFPTDLVDFEKGDSENKLKRSLEQLQLPIMMYWCITICC